MPEDKMSLVFPQSLLNYNVIFLKFTAKDIRTDPAKIGQQGFETIEETKIIYLPVTEQIPTELTLKWSGPSTVATSIEAAQKIVTGAVLGNLGGKLGQIVETLIGKSTGAGASPDNASVGDIARNTSLAVARQQVAPTLKQLFQGVDFRNFTFNFKFIPANENEANEIYQILEAFQYYSLPSVATANSMLQWPAEWDVELVHSTEDTIQNTSSNNIIKTQRLNNLMAFRRLVCTNVKINYGNADGFYYYSDGQPNVIDMTLSFSETDYLTREKFKASKGSV
jgi:hypothetical protein